MSYTTGTANSATDLRTAIFAACVASGWTLASPVMSKGPLAMQIDLSTVGTAQGLSFTGGKSVSAGALVSAAPYGVSMGNRTNLAFTWPATYHIFTFENPDEVYVVVNYDVDKFQWAAWGKSAHQLPGSGMWFASMLSANAGSPQCTMFFTNAAELGSFSYTQPALFWRDENGVGGAAGYIEAQMHHGLDGDFWTEGGTTKKGPFAAWSANPLLSLLPNAWNSEVVLLPIQALVSRASNMTSLVVTCANARYLRIDNYAPGAIITLGADRWIVFPWLRKDSSRRNGMPGAVSADLHSGTLGWAIRYEGL